MNVIAATVVALVLAGSPLAASAGAPTEQSPAGHDDDFGVLLTDMFATMADVLAQHQDQTANEAYLGSASSTHRLRAAIETVPDTSVRGARPFVSGWLLGDD